MATDYQKAGETMLKDALNGLIEKAESGKTRDCKLCSVIASQDKETSQIIVKALQSNASTMSIVRAMNAEGILISREYVGERRRVCFRTPDSKCEHAISEGTK